MSLNVSPVHPAELPTITQETVEKDKKRVESWKKYGLPESMLERHMDCVQFLYETSLVHPVVGYRETSGNNFLHDIKLDQDGHPLIRVQGEFKRWERIKQELVYDPQTYKIRSLDYPGALVQNWTYLHPQGLVPIDRMAHHTMVPIYQLNAAEVQQVQTFARKFYETNPEVDQGIPKDWVVQFHTSPRRQFVASLPPLPDNPLLDNFAKNLNTHIVMRLIAPNGEVYSFGIEMPADSQEFLWEGGMAKFLGTVTASVNKAGDYEEFRPHAGRIVTSIPLTTQRAQNILKYVNQLGDIRFNFLRQNCANLMKVVLNMTGYDVEIQTNIAEFLSSSLPDLKYIPVIGPTADKVYQFFKIIFQGIASFTPQPMQKAFTCVKDTCLFVPRKLITLAINLAVLKLGGRAMLRPLQAGVEEDDLYKANRFLNFSTLIRSWKDLFSERISEINHSKFFIDWQKQQKSTFVGAYSGKPKLIIVPPTA